MRLGIDFGTSRIVVAVADRGNYPVVSFEAPDGEAVEWIPPVIGVRGNEVAYGWDAWRHYSHAGWSHLRSVKSVLSTAGPHSLVHFGTVAWSVQDLLAGLAQRVRADLHGRSNVRPAPGETLEVVLGVPALANSNQRYLTVEAFARAGFHVLALVNEPSAAAVEFGHRKAGVQEPESVLVYDFGGGTFDVSLVRREESAFHVLASESVPTLGGDEFDDVLAELALRQTGRLDERHGLSQAQEFLLIEECRQKKEAIHPNSRKITLELDPVCAGWGEVQVPVAEYYEACLPMVEETLALTEQVLEKSASLEHGKPPVLYLTGGASELPLVSRMVRERFGRRVHRSAYMRSATAIGLAIHADGALAAPLKERFTRHFGLWREREGGERIVFDPLIRKGEALPLPGEPPVHFGCAYSPAHNIGHYRYLECTALDDDGAPTGDLTPWDEIRFPFDPRLAGLADLAGIPVERTSAAADQRIEEEYEVSSSGTVTVRLRNAAAGYEREFALGRWAPKKAPAARRRHRARPGV